METYRGIEALSRAPKDSTDTQKTKAQEKPKRPRPLWRTSITRKTEMSQMKTFLFSMVLLVASCQSPLRNAEAQQTRVYDANGRSVGTAVPQGEGTTRFYDSRGHSLGTSTTTGNTTRFYGERGQPMGSTVGPSSVDRAFNFKK
jgi:hypothetical protein